ncbi:hypothetical protein [Streptomyces mirabilis]|uniref:hypothetical protein n=1 Tax=Streptomyces mirabilis TaxID=68239 RepID=UPI0036515825
MPGFLVVFRKGGGLDDVSAETAASSVGHDLQAVCFVVGVAELQKELGEACSMAAEVVLRAFTFGNGFRIREWTDWCSSLILDIHQEFDALLSSAHDGAPIFYPAPEKPELTETEALELRDQLAALDLLRHGVGSDQLRTINEEGNSWAASALSWIVGRC